MKKRKRIAVISIALIGTMIFALLLESLGLWKQDKAYAASSLISYSDGARIIAWNQRTYSGESSHSAAISLDAGAGKVITDAYYVENGQTKHITEAVGKQTWSGSKTITGKEWVVTSTNNNTTKGYYAWDRYSPGGPNGVSWYASGDGACTKGPMQTASPDGMCQPSTVKYEDVNGYQMPEWPGVKDRRLSLTGKLENGFLTSDGISLGDDLLVTPTAADYTVTPNTDYPIQGPGGLSGKTDPYPTEIRVGDIKSAGTFTVYYSQDFNHLGKTKEHDAPGAKMTIYFSAFFIDVKTKTYEYPTYVTFTVQDAAANPTPTTAPTPIPIQISGDFDILPSTINYRDSFTLHPKNFQIPTGCTYNRHSYKLARNGSTSRTAYVTRRTQDSSFSYSTYPSVIGVGYHDVSINIETSCGSTGWIANKGLTVNGPATNNPPFFKLGWFRDGDYSSKERLTQVVQGTKVNVRPIDDPDWKPPSPSDPDGDSFSVTGWDFDRSSQWVSSLPGKYGFQQNYDYLSGITAETVGYHTVYATMTDEFGASYTTSAMLEVIPPNPVPVAACPPEVKENRTILDSAFDASKSYSPLGRAIDHTKDEWTNKKSMYTNGTSANIVVKASLHVYDNGDPPLKSLEPDTCDIVVKPDLPPVAKLDVPPLGIRGQTYELFNKSTSPDGDTITSFEYRYKYDGNNNGFSDDNWISLPGTTDKANFAPSKVGKYLFYIKVTEDYGKSEDTSAENEVSLTMNVINLAPTVSFVIEGMNEQPQVSTPTSYSAESILKNWSLTDVNTNRKLNNRYVNWISENGLTAGSGVPAMRQYVQHYDTTFFGNNFYRAYMARFNDHGYGANNLSPWRSATSTIIQYSFPLLTDPVKSTDTLGMYYNESPAIRANQKMFYVNARDRVYAVNKDKIGRFQGNLGFYTWDGTYLDGSPYEFILKLDNLTTLPDGTPFYGEKDLLGYELADQTLYLLVQWHISGGWKSEIFMYDAFTGQQTGRSGFGPVTYGWEFNEKGRDPGVNALGAYAKNDHMLFFLYNGDKALEYDRTGRLVKTWDVPISPPYQMPKREGSTYTPSCGKTAGPLYKGENGEFYRIEYDSCNLDLYGYSKSIQNLSVVRINPDMTLGWRTKLAGQDPTYDNACNRGFVLRDKSTFMIVNSKKNEILVPSFTYPGAWDCNQYVESINMDTGQATQLTSTDKRFGIGMGTSTFYIDWDGNYIDPWNGYTNVGVVSAEGNITRLSGDSTGTNNYVYNKSAQQIGSVGSGGTYGFATRTTGPSFGTYVGDGIYVSVHNSSSWGYSNNNDLRLWVSKGTPSTTPLLIKRFNLGQFLSDFTVDNSELQFNLTMDKVDYDTQWAGLSFRAQDGSNRYALETDGKVLQLNRYVGGTKTVLQSINYPFQSGTAYSFKISAMVDKIEVSLNGVPYFSVTDSTFSSGKMGPFSDKAFVHFSGISSKAVKPPKVDWFTNFAIWEETTRSASIRYTDVTMTDPENDPIAGSRQWTFKHTAKFLNNQGLSALDGKTYSAEQLTFDKVGVYEVTLRAKDDPHPNYRYPSMVFDEYRKLSNAYKQVVTVHRRPVADFSLSTKTDGTIAWADTSYDPDRYVSDSIYSLPDVTGIDYRATRGIMERKYSYTSPSGLTVNEKLARPQETGSYSVTLTVRDEYGAWSLPVTKTVTAGTVVPPNQKPKAILTYPSGSQANPTKTTTHRPTITWNQSDGDAGTVFKGYHVMITDETGSMIIETGEKAQNTSSGTASWNVPSDLPWGVNLQVKVRVSDGEQWSDWSNIGWLFINNRPTATVTTPSGTQASPTVYDTQLPTLSLVQSDPDPGTTFKQYQFEIWNEANTSKIADSGQLYQNSQESVVKWKVNTSLPLGQKLRVRARVSDGIEWSNWSAYTWMYMNRPPLADFSWTPNTPWEGDPIRLINKSVDPDGDLADAKYEWAIEGPGYSVPGRSTAKDSAIPGEITEGHPGSYAVTLTVTDGYGQKDSATKTIRVSELGISGQVRHTPGWKANLDRFNASNPEGVRSASTFWTGEAFWLIGTPTDTGPSGPKAEEIAVDAPGIGSVYLSPGTRLDWSETLASDNASVDLQTLSDGPYDFTFSVTYSNGVRKQAAVRIYIAGKWTDYYRYHRSY